MSSTGTSTLRSKALRAPGVHDRHRPRLPGRARPRRPQVAGHLVERPLGGGEADPLQRRTGDLLEPLEGQREVRAALRAHEGVDLVHDHHLDRREQGARLRGQDEEERLRGGDEDVGRAAGPCAPARLAGVSPVRIATRGGGTVFAAPAGHAGDAGERGAEVALDVHGQGARAARRRRRGSARPRGGRGREHEPVDGRQERGQRLARARWARRPGSTRRPWIAAQPRRLRPGGCGKVSANHSSTAAWKPGAGAGILMGHRSS